MRVSYDSEVDALSIRLIEGQAQCRTLRLSDEVALNIGLGETLEGIEVLDASRILGTRGAPRLIVENLRVAAAPAARPSKRPAAPRARAKPAAPKARRRSAA